jgi:hypothetical protein
MIFFSSVEIRVPIAVSIRFNLLRYIIMLLVPQYECTRVAKCLIRSSSSPMVLVDSDACLDSIRSIALFL